jgi:hypothetical protein
MKQVCDLFKLLKIHYAPINVSASGIVNCVNIVDFADFVNP